MNAWQIMVENFHHKFGQPIRDAGGVVNSRPELRTALIEEEAKEMCAAIRRGDMAEVIDGACDLIYVVLGTMVEDGINLDPFFTEVHRTNMAKTGGPVRGDGKILKPEGWKPPRIAEFVKAGIGVVK